MEKPDQRNYYIPVSDKTFNEIKENAIKIWETYEDGTSYSTEKVESIKDLENISDNGMYIISKFDTVNMLKLFKKLSTKAITELKDKRLPHQFFQI